MERDQQVEVGAQIEKLSQLDSRTLDCLKCLISILFILRRDYFYKLVKENSRMFIKISFNTGDEQFQIIEPIKKKIMRLKPISDADLESMKFLVDLISLSPELVLIWPTHTGKIIFSLTLGIQSEINCYTMSDESLTKKSDDIYENIKKATHEKGCWTCGKKPESGEVFKKCGKCRTFAYCGRECQREDWAKHKTLCSDIIAAKIYSNIVLE